MIKFNEEKIQGIRWANKVLKDSLKHFKMIIGRSHYDCNYIKVKKERYENNKYHGMVERNQFGNYLNSVYGKNHLEEMPYYKHQEIDVTDINIYDEDWTKEYGNTYDNSPDLYKEEFTCETMSASSSSFGIVTRVSKNSIWVEEYYSEVELKFSSCSVLQIAYGEKARAGSHIAWKG